MDCAITKVTCRRADANINILAQREDASISATSARTDRAIELSLRSEHVNVNIGSTIERTHIILSIKVTCEIGSSTHRLLRTKGGRLLRTRSGNYLYVIK